MAHLAERNYLDKLKAALEQHLGRTVALKVAVGEAVNGTAAAIEAGEREARRADAAKAVQQDKFVQDLVDIFDAKVVGSTIKASADKA
jgi:DNA polymerase-3 subunit gamma/tau